MIMTIVSHILLRKARSDDHSLVGGLLIGTGAATLFSSSSCDYHFMIWYKLQLVVFFWFKTCWCWTYQGLQGSLGRVAQQAGPEVEITVASSRITFWSSSWSFWSWSFWSWSWLSPEGLHWSYDGLGRGGQVEADQAGRCLESRWGGVFSHHRDHCQDDSDQFFSLRMIGMIMNGKSLWMLTIEELTCRC